MQRGLRALLGAVSVTQRGLLKGTLVSVVTALLFPPWHFQGPTGVVFGLGWGFLFSGREYNGHLGTVNVPLLLAEWLAIGIISAILWRLGRGTDEPTLRSSIITLAAAIRSRNDAIAESARIQADATIRAAEITAQRRQMDLLDHHR